MYKHICVSYTHMSESYTHICVSFTHMTASCTHMCVAHVEGGGSYVYVNNRGRGLCAYELYPYDCVMYTHVEGEGVMCM